MGLDAWELERLLHRLATTSAGSTNARRERRSRSRGHFLAGASGAQQSSRTAGMLARLSANDNDIPWM